MACDADPGQAGWKPTSSPSSLPPDPLAAEAGADNALDRTEHRKRREPAGLEVAHQKPTEK